MSTIQIAQKMRQPVVQLDQPRAKITGVILSAKRKAEANPPPVEEAYASATTL